jgi:hypothetical protein
MAVSTALNAFVVQPELVGSLADALLEDAIHGGLHRKHK